MAKIIVLVVFVVVWGAATIIVAIQEKGKVPPEYWTIPAIGVGAILGAFAAWGDKSNNRPEPRSRPDPEEDSTSRDST